MVRGDPCVRAQELKLLHPSADVDILQSYLPRMLPHHSTNGTNGPTSLGLAAARARAPFPKSRGAVHNFANPALAPLCSHCTSARSASKSRVQNSDVIRACRGLQEETHCFFPNHADATTSGEALSGLNLTVAATIVDRSC